MQGTSSSIIPPAGIENARPLPALRPHSLARLAPTEGHLLNDQPSKIKQYLSEGC